MDMIRSQSSCTRYPDPNSQEPRICRMYACSYVHLYVCCCGLGAWGFASESAWFAYPPLGGRGRWQARQMKNRICAADGARVTCRCFVGFLSLSAISLLNATHNDECLVVSISSRRLTEVLLLALDRFLGSCSLGSCWDLAVFCFARDRE